MSQQPLSIAFAGDVMTGRGVDQVLGSPSDPELREVGVRDAREYVRLAEAANGPIPAPVGPEWPWGDALVALDDLRPDVRVLNLETSVTTSAEFAPGKQVTYRMHPDNVGCLAVARPDVCVLANNHVLDFGVSGLLDTLDTLDAAGLRYAGAGRSADEARAPAVVDAGTRRVAVHAVADASSGVPSSWAATDSLPGVVYVAHLSDAAADGILARVTATPDAVTVVSVHAGSNWGYDVPGRFVRFAHRLVDGGVDVVFGHSSHHPRPVEVYHGGLVLYGCGDLVNDYEGIAGRESFRSDLRLLYVATLGAGSHALAELRMVPLRARRLRLERATDADTEWLRARLDRISRPFGTTVCRESDGTLLVSGSD